MNEQSLPSSGVYEILNTINGNRYVGSAVNLHSRKGKHIHSLCGWYSRHPYLQNAWNKYGEDAFVFRVLLYCDEEMLLTFEQLAIDQKSEYNILKVAGSSLGYKHTDEDRAKISEAHTGRIHTDESRANMSKGLTGNQNALGYNHTPETIAIISKANMGNQHGLGYKHTLEAKAQMSKTRKGRRHTATAKAKMSKTHMGRKFSDEHRANISKANRKLAPSSAKEVRRLLATGNMSQREIAKLFSVCQQTISNINTGRACSDN